MVLRPDASRCSGGLASIGEVAASRALADHGAMTGGHVLQESRLRLIFELEGECYINEWPFYH